MVLSMLGRKEWIEGIFFWMWSPLLKEYPYGFSPYNKKAEEVIKEFWKEE